MEVSKEKYVNRLKTNHSNAKEIFIKALNDNKVIAYPTDTIYGVGTAIRNNEGIHRINEMKKREQPMTIALANFDIIKNEIATSQQNILKVIDILKDGSTCIARYKRGAFNEKITKNGKIGFRIPNHDFLKSVLELYNKPITTTSINKTGFDPLYIPDEIEEKFGNKIDLLFDDGLINNNPSKIFLLEKDELKQIR